MSPKLPVITPKKLIRALIKAGFILDHQTGGHRYYTHPERPTKIVTIPYHNKDIKKGTLKSILKQADIDAQTLIELL
jgi:predicted RNA binding protein YcfA (HicA-like mRNA interferase family)